jgi:hypothetical protein
VIRTALLASLALAAILLLGRTATAARACSNEFVWDELRSGAFGRIDRIADIPKEVLAELQRTIAPAETGAVLVDPGEPFQATDVVGPEGPLTARRLVFAAFSKTLYYVYYERGGIANTRHVFVYCHHEARERFLSVLAPPVVTAPRDLAVGLRREQIVAPPREH